MKSVDFNDINYLNDNFLNLKKNVLINKGVLVSMTTII